MAWVIFGMIYWEIHVPNLYSSFYNYLYFILTIGINIFLGEKYIMLFILSSLIVTRFDLNDKQNLNSLFYTSVGDNTREKKPFESKELTSLRRYS